MSSSESTLKCAYGAGTSRGCQPAMTGTKEHSEKPLCGTLPDWNVWCIGGGVGNSRGRPWGVLLWKKKRGTAPSPPRRVKGGVAHRVSVAICPQRFRLI